ncbi:hypothetical protein AMB3_4131 [plant metagenome]
MVKAGNGGFLIYVGGNTALIGIVTPAASRQQPAGAGR